VRRQDDGTTRKNVAEVERGSGPGGAASEITAEQASAGSGGNRDSDASDFPDEEEVVRAKRGQGFAPEPSSDTAAALAQVLGYYPTPARINFRYCLAEERPMKDGHRRGWHGDMPHLWDISSAFTTVLRALEECEMAPETIDISFTKEAPEWTAGLAQCYALAHSPTCLKNLRYLWLRFIDDCRQPSKSPLEA